MIIEIDIPSIKGNRLMSREGAEALVKYPALLVNALAHDWIRPLGRTGNHIRAHELFSRREVEDLVERFKAGDFPPPVPTVPDAGLGITLAGEVLRPVLRAIGIGGTVLYGIEARAGGDGVRP